MNLGFAEEQAEFASPSQNARVWTEGWTSRWLFCPACGCEDISRFANNTPAADFHCPECHEQYELKSKKGKFGAKVVDGAYSTLCARLSSDTNPNFAFLSYDLNQRAVQSFFVVPKQFVVPSIIEKRKPLAPTAKRAGWIGCNIQLHRIPEPGKVFMVRGGEPLDKALVRQNWQRTLFLREENLKARGWLVDVMACCEAIKRTEFSIDDIYSFERQLSALYPENNNVRPKIRQQLQVLRDGGYLQFLGAGRYRLT